MGNLFKIILTVMANILVLFVVGHFIISSIKNKEFNVNELIEDTTEEKTEFYDLSTIISFDDHIFCLNETMGRITVLSKDGEFTKNIQMPYINNHGTNLMYIYHNQLCILDKNSTIYQYSNVDEYKKIVLENGNKVISYDAEGQEIQSMNIEGEYLEILLMLNDRCYLYGVEDDKEIIAVYDANGLIKKETVDYEKLVNLHGVKMIEDNGIKYEIGVLKNSLIRINGTQKSTMRRSTFFEQLFLSDFMSMSMLVIIVILVFLINVPHIFRKNKSIKV